MNMVARNLELRWGQRQEKDDNSTDERVIGQAPISGQMGSRCNGKASALTREIPSFGNSILALMSLFIRYQIDHGSEGTLPRACNAIYPDSAVQC